METTGFNQEGRQLSLFKADVKEVGTNCKKRFLSPSVCSPRLTDEELHCKRVNSVSAIKYSEKDDLFLFVNQNCINKVFTV